MTIAIIADDLTGANDSGLQFASLGMPTTVYLEEAPDTSQDSAVDGRPPVAVIDTETRGLTADEVPVKMQTVVDRLQRAGTRQVYKKIDSTMRGHVGLELVSVAQALSADFIFLTPAFPAMKRTVEKGHLLVDGVPVNQTPIARDPGFPVTESNLVTLLRPSMAGLTLTQVSLDQLKTPTDLMARLQGQAAGGQRQCVIFDSMTDQDLAVVAEFGTTLARAGGFTVLWAGSAGLAAQLPRAWGVPVVDGVVPTLTAATRPPLMVIGSVNPVSIAQLDYAVNRLNVRPVSLSPDAMLGTAEEQATEIARGIQALHGALDEQGTPLPMVLTTAHTSDDVDRIVARAAAMGISRGEAGRRIAHGLAAVAQEILQADRINRLVSAGGDTSRAIMDAVGITAMRVNGAIDAGIPVVSTCSGPRRHIVTKAGGFGAPDALLKAMSFLTHGSLV